MTDTPPPATADAPPATATTPQGSATTGSPAPTLTRNGMILVIAALVIMSGFSAWVVAHYQSDDATNAATILGIVIPAFATIGAAAFGVTVAYKSGNEQGQAAGQQQGQQAAASAMAGHVNDAEQALATLKEQIQRQALSTPGTRDLVLGIQPVDPSELASGSIRLAAEPTRLDTEPLEQASASLARARGALESFMR